MQSKDQLLKEEENIILRAIDKIRKKVYVYILFKYGDNLFK